MLHCPGYNVTKTQNRRCWFTWAKPKSKCDFINYFWVAKTQVALWLVTTAVYEGKIHFSTTAGMRLNHHGNFKVQHCKLFEKNKKRLLCPTFPYTERPLSCYTSNRLLLTNLECPISTLRGGMGLHYGREITPSTDSESRHRRLKRCFWR